MTIGKHEWRLVQYRDTSTEYVTDEVTGVGRYVDVLGTFVEHDTTQTRRDPRGHGKGRVT